MAMGLKNLKVDGDRAMEVRAKTVIKLKLENGASLDLEFDKGSDLIKGLNSWKSFTGVELQVKGEPDEEPNTQR